ncbi:MAG: aryl-sulfate sulfotransferase [Myxococcota bacterium]
MLFSLFACVDNPTPVPDTASVEDTGEPCAAVDGAPAFTLVSGALDGEVLLPWYDPVDEQAGVVVVGSGGCVVESYQTGLFPTAARWVGDSLWYNTMGPEQSLNRIDGISGETETFATPRGHHDFVVLDDGTVAWLAEEVREIDGVSILGDLVRERAPDGTERQVWSAFEQLDLADSTTVWCGEKTPRDWTHANGMAWSPERDAYLVSLYCLAQVVEIDRASGRHLRVLDGAAATSPFGPQHAPSVSPTGVRLFDNAGPDGASRLIEVSWDAEITWSWAPADGLATPVLGDHFMRDDGVRLASFGAEGVVLALDPAGQELWRIVTPGVVVGRLDWRP